MISMGAKSGSPTSSRIELLLIREHIPDSNARRSFCSRDLTICRRKDLRLEQHMNVSRGKCNTLQGKYTSKSYLQRFLSM